MIVPQLKAPVTLEDHLQASRQASQLNNKHTGAPTGVTAPVGTSWPVSKSMSN
jgi:hypothetical protein